MTGLSQRGTEICPLEPNAVRRAAKETARGMRVGRAEDQRADADHRRHAVGPLRRARENAGDYLRAVRAHECFELVLDLGSSLGLPNGRAGERDDE